MSGKCPPMNWNRFELKRNDLVLEQSKKPASAQQNQVSLAPFTPDSSLHFRTVDCNHYLSEPTLIRQLFPYSFKLFLRSQKKGKL